MGKTILIVDDSASFRQVVAMSLNQAGYEVLQAADGKEALGLMDGRKIHLVVSDLNMPVMDGLTFVHEAKALAAYKFTPVILLTTVTSDEKKAQAKAEGVRAWITKPFQPPVLLDAVSKLVLP